MASFFGNRPSYVTASWANQRIYPRQEPTFESTDPAASLRRTGSRPSTSFPPSIPPPTSPSSAAGTDTASTPTPAPRERPPPLYFPGVHRQSSLGVDPYSPGGGATARDSDLPPNHIPSINVATTRLTIVEWSYHPIPLKDEVKGWKAKARKWTRFAEIGTSLRQDREVLWDGWPVAFGGSPRSTTQGHAKAKRGSIGTGRSSTSHDEESRVGSGQVSRSLSRRSGQSRADSGIALSRGPTNDGSQVHPLEPLYRKRVGELNELIGDQLIMTRGWLALTELLWVVWFVALIIALGTGQGQQSGFLKGVEIGLVCVIILSALAINGVRMRRWALAEQLRKRTRDWSPLPITSSTNAQLMRNYLDGDADERTGIDGQPMIGVATANAGAGTLSQSTTRRKDSPVLRWRLRETEGSYWISYRPIIRCELITPATYINPFAPVAPHLADVGAIPEGLIDVVLHDEVATGLDSGGIGHTTAELPPGYVERA